MSTWNWVQLAAALLVAVIFGVGRKLPSWLGFVFMLAASALVVVVGFATTAYRFVPLGFAALIGTAVAWASGATAAPEENDDTLGGTADHIPGWAWAVIAGLMVVGIILAMVLKK